MLRARYRVTKIRSLTDAAISLPPLCFIDDVGRRPPERLRPERRGRHQQHVVGGVQPRHPLEPQEPGNQDPLRREDPRAARQSGMGFSREFVRLRFEV